jgi:peptidylprolyl isomerase
MRRLVVLPLLLALASVAAACGSGSPSADNTTTTSTAPTTSAPTTSTTSAATTSSTTTSTGAGTNVPTVAAATNTQVEPVIAPGSSPAPTKLVTKDLVVGTGKMAVASSTVVVKYVGADYTTGVDFTSSTWSSGKATSFPLSTVVPGFKEGIVGMRVGGRREIVIPSALGYGPNGQPPTIKPNETLVFVVDLESLT